MIDASVAVKWVVDEPDSDAALTLLRECEALHAPAHWLAEAATALWAKAAHRRVLSRPESLERVNFLASLPITTAPLQEIIGRATELAHDLALTIYDTLYVALAERLNLTVVTADRQLAERSARDPVVAPHVRWIGETAT